MSDAMTPPQDKGQGNFADAPEAPPAVLLCPPVTTMSKRAEFLKAAAARRQGTAGFLLQARDRHDDAPGIHVGFTASKKIGNAVLRNRAKRRLRAIAREMLPGRAQPGWDYVLVARPGATVSRLYADLLIDLEIALCAVHKARS